MLVPPSPLARLRWPRRRPRPPARVSRRFVTRPAAGTPAAKDAQDEPDPADASPPKASWAWTLYSRWEWITATARAERVLRRSRPPWN